MQGIVRTSLQLRFLVLVLAAALIIFGVNQLRATPIDVLPEFDPPLVEVQTEALGLSAAEVESLITVPMEADLLNGVAWLDQIYSESVAGLSSILLVFEPGTDPIKARQMVQERLTQAHALPNVSTPPVMLQPLSASSRAMLIGLSSEQLSLIDLGVLARWTIKPRLIGVPGVANVAIWGQRERQMQVQIDPEQLAANGVSLQQVIETTGEALWVSPLSYLESSSPGTAGWIDTPNQRLNIRHTLPIRTTANLAMVPIAGSGGLTLGDIATVVEDHQPLIGDARIQDSPGLLLVVQKLPGASTLDLTRAVEETLAEMAPGLGGVEVDTTIFRPATYLESALGNLTTIILIGAGLLTLTLLLCFFSWRAALISLIAVAAALLSAIGVLTLGGATLNMLVLAGLAVALCIVLDDAIAGVEHTMRRLREHGQSETNGSVAEIIVTATLELRRPLGFATLILLLTLLPIFFFEGLAGPLFRPFALTYALALLAALLVALVVIPALSLILFPRAGLTRAESPLITWLRGGYRKLLGPALRAASPALLLVVVLLAGSVALLPGLVRQAPLPALRQTNLLIQWQGAPGTSGAEMNRIIEQVSRELEGVQGVRNVGSHVGRAITGDKTVGVNAGELWVALDPSADYAATRATMQAIIDGYPGLFRDVRSYLPARLGEALATGDQSLVVRVYGTELSVLGEKAEEVRQKLASLGGVTSASALLPTEEPQLEIEVDLAAAERYQIKPGDVRRTVTTLLSGLYVGNLFEDQKVFDVVVWGKPAIRNSLSDVNNLLIETPGGPVRLSELADVRIVPAPTHIRRDAVSRYVDVVARVEGRSLVAVAANVRAALGTLSFPREFHAELLDTSIERQAASWRMLSIVVAVAIGAFLLMQAALNSWRLALLAVLTTPAALAGAVAAAALTGAPIVATGFGLLAVLGLAVRTTLTLLDRYQQLQQHEGCAFGPELAADGALERCGPTVTTLLASALALAPAAVAGPVAGLELAQPIAVVILGGLVTTLLHSLFIVPALYLRFGVAAEPDWEPRLVPTGGASD